MNDDKIFITGASSGIGRALAEQYAAPGITLGLVARRRELLEEVKSNLGEKGAKVIIYQGDVTDVARMAEITEDFVENAAGIGLVIANAGRGGADKLREGDPTRITGVIDVNLAGVVNTLVPFVPAMIAQNGGHLVSIGSVAGFKAFPGRAGYGATKAAVKTLMDGFRLDLRKHHIRVSTICPGWVESELSAKNNFKMPFFLKSDKAARLIMKAIRRKKKTYVFPWQWRLLLPLIVRLPDWIFPDFS